MNMKQAKEKLMELVGNEYHSIEYKLTDAGNGNASQVCKVYAHDHGSFEAPHWDAAIAALESSINGGPPITEDMPISSRVNA